MGDQIRTVSQKQSFTFRMFNNAQNWTDYGVDTYCLIWNSNYKQSTSSNFEARLETEKAETDIILFFFNNSVKIKMHYVEWSIQKKSHATNEVKYLSQKNILSSHPLPDSSEELGEASGTRGDLWGASLGWDTSGGRGGLAPEGP